MELSIQTRSPLSLALGVKTDPIEYRYSHQWLFKILADERVGHVQLGTFFEIYQLPDEYFTRLRDLAGEYDLAISSVFTSHRELGGFFCDDPAWQQIARKNYERLIEIGALVGARSVGSNPGAALRDRMETKPDGIRRYLRHMRELMEFAAERGVGALTMEPMSCLAEPPTLPDEIRAMADELAAHHIQNPDGRARIGYCADISHGYADASRSVRWDNIQLLEATLPYLQELHLRNTDELFNKTFGFSEEERAQGIVRVDQLRDILLANADVIPVKDLVGYFEIGGPKTGRDYSDHLLEANLRESLAYLRETFPTDVAAKDGIGGVHAPNGGNGRIVLAARGDKPEPVAPVQIAPSMMCADILRLGEDTRILEAAGVDLLHFDLMDAHFVPNMPLGLGVLEQLRAQTALPFDVHLMVTDNDFFVDKVLRIGVQQIAIHAESAVHLDRTLATIRDAGVKAGVALNPATPMSALDFVIERLDFVLLMTVNPGFASQKMVPSALRKIAECREYLTARGLDIPIEVDGNVSFEAIPKMVAAGADILVAGTSSVFRKPGSLAANVRRSRELACEGLVGRSGDVAAKVVSEVAR